MNGQSKEPIRLRQRRTPSGLTSLYLDIYMNGRRSYEYLKLYLVPERTRADKEKNRETLKLADAIRAKRVVEFRNGQYGFQSQFAAGTLFFPYCRQICENMTGGNLRVWATFLKHLAAYERNENITFRDITAEWVKGFKKYLSKDRVGLRKTENKRLSCNSMMVYFSKLKACLNRAVADEIIEVSPAQHIDNFKKEEGTRMYLTIEEVKRLAQTDCEHPRVKAAFLFSCLTGLRRSDVLRITWGDVHTQGDFTRIIFRQKKTRGQEYLDITEQAAELMGERGKSTERVFKGIFSPMWTNSIVQMWVLRAGIDKKITFHCARHTFATMMLDLGTDIYTVSKLLGHREISTTQIYAKVLDKNKQRAVASIPDVLHGAGKHDK